MHILDDNISFLQIYVLVSHMTTLVFVAAVAVYCYIPTERVLCVLFPRVPISAMALLSLYPELKAHAYYNPALTASFGPRRTPRPSGILWTALHQRCHSSRFRAL